MVIEVRAHPEGKNRTRKRQGEISMKNIILCCLGAGIFLLTAVRANAAQEKSAAPTADRLTTAQGARTAAEGVPDRPELHRRNPRYQLCKDDILQLNFIMTPEFDQTVTVQPDGFITLLGVGDLHVEGQTIPDVTRLIRTAYAQKLHNPILTVRLMDFEKPYYIVGGEVGHPGKFELRGDTTLAQAVAVAGGFTESSKHSQVLLFRRVSNDWVETQQFNVKKMLKDGNLSEDAHLRPGDMLYVPKNTLSKMKRFIPVATLGTYFNPGAL
jgi:polysaccharide export outer membrane protein